MQTIQTALAKAGSCLTQLAEKVQEDQPILGEVVNALALLGHGFHAFCLRRRELIKPDLKSDYTHLCSPSVPHTDYLFGDEVEKRVKDIRDVNQAGSRIQRSTPRPRGGFHGGFQGGRWNLGRNGPNRSLNYRPARFPARGNGPHPSTKSKRMNAVKPKAADKN